MADQITHKKSLKKLDKNKRLLLKQYYQLESGLQAEQQDKFEDKLLVKESPLEGQEIPEDTKEASLVITESNFKELLQSHNVLLGKEAAASNSIKNTIYENYYDLVKVNKLLGEMSEPPIEIKLRKLVENVQRIRG